MRFWKRLRVYLTPSPAALMMIWIASGFLAVGSLCIASMPFLGPLEQPLIMVGFGFSFFVLPGTALFWIIGAFRTPRYAARAVMLAVALLLCVAATVLIALVIRMDVDKGSEGAAFGMLIICAPFLLALSGLVVYFGLRGWPEVRRMFQADRAERTVEMLLARGEVSFAELAGELSMPLDEVDNFVDNLLRSGQLMGMMDAAGQRVYTALRLAEKQQMLLSVVQAHGQIRLETLAQELNAPVELVHDWIYQLVQRGQFSGYVNWQKGVLYSAEGHKLRQLGTCPQCGGALDLAGKGIIRCQYCQSEIFL